MTAFTGLLAALAAAPAARAAGSGSSRGPWPDAAAVQAGVSPRSTSAVLALRWTWAWRRDLGGATLSGGWDVTAGGWRNRGDDGEDGRSATQLSLTPVLRWGAAPGTPGTFAEGGIGVAAVTPVYRHRDHRFSTVFNFADHVAAGVAFGPLGRHELVLRVQHFSNAGVREPNPGEDFLQLRYLVRF